MKYFSGEQIHPGDAVLLRRNESRIPAVVVRILEPGGVEAREWNALGGGVLIEGGGLGLSLTENPEADSELSFVSRAGQPLDE